ncbi:CLUMA_CG004040, isoform A [Clunio marinus]|uniref:CLUMA_CG004040, isoform A n=1 Tax=Clunio marinus TaxID=568069 RepID=A0A1J1HQP4_9DIPT|nr:CLUMA_CG004040, isoform A [Clunio marinus]
MSLKSYTFTHSKWNNQVSEFCRRHVSINKSLLSFMNRILLNSSLTQDITFFCDKKKSFYEKTAKGKLITGHATNKH